MRKFWLSLMGLTLVGTTSLTTISCGTQPLGWSGSQYWMVLDYQDFHNWMKNVDLISQDDWKTLSESKKQKSWETVQNVDLNNFMTMMNLTYNYLNWNSDPLNAEPKEIDELDGFYYNFGYAILEHENSFADRFLNLKYQDQPLIRDQDWQPLDENTYLNDFKSNQLNNKFIFHSNKKEDSGNSPIKMSITAGNSNIPADSDIVKVWKPIATAIQEGKGNSDEVIKNLWAGLVNWHFESFIFTFKIWPVEKGWPISFQINLTFDV